MEDRKGLAQRYSDHSRVAKGLQTASSPVGKARRQGQPLFSAGDSTQVIYTFDSNGLTLMCTFGYLDLCLATGYQNTTGDELNPRLRLRFINLLSSVDYLYLPG